MKRIAFLAAGLFALSPLTASACDLCGAYNPELKKTGVESVEGAAGTAATGIFAGWSHRFTHYESNVRQAGFERFPGQHIESNISQFLAGAEVLPKTVLQFNLPEIHRRYQRVTDRRVDKGTESGIGDAVFQARYVLPSYEDTCAAGQMSLHSEVFAGLKMPTGSSDMLATESHSDELALRHGNAGEGNLIGGDDLALGSGSWDPMLGAKLVFYTEAVFTSAKVSYDFRQPGDHDYAYGQGVDWGGSLGTEVLGDNISSLLVSAELRVEYKSRDRLSGHELSGSEDRRIFLGPQFTYVASESLSLTTGVDLPLYTESAADGVVPHYRLNASVVGRF